MGFVLGAGIAARLGVGFLPIRKAGKLCVDTDRVEFSNYSVSRLEVFRLIKKPSKVSTG